MARTRFNRKVSSIPQSNQPYQTDMLSSSFGGVDANLTHVNANHRTHADTSLTRANASLTRANELTHANVSLAHGDTRLTHAAMTSGIFISKIGYYK